MMLFTEQTNATDEADLAGSEDNKSVTDSTEPNKMRWLLAVVVVASAFACWIVTGENESTASLWRTYRVPGMLLNLASSYLAICTLYYLLGSGEKRMRIFRLILITMAFTSVMVLVESPVVLLGYNYEKTFGTGGQDTWLDMSDDVNKPDPELLHIHWPHSTFKGNAFGNLVSLGIGQPTTYHVDLKYDRNGFRNDTDLNQADMVVIGDSFIEAALLPVEDTVVKLLERRLGQTAVNLGQAAYGLKQELIVLKRYGLPLKPKIVFWFFFGGNDLRDVAGYEWSRSHFEEFRAPPPMRSRLFVRNALLALSRITTPPLSKSTESALSRSGLFTLPDKSIERIYFGQTNKTWTQHEWEVFTETLTAANELCRGAGAELVVVYISRKFRVYQPFLTFEPGNLASMWKVNELPKAVDAWCKQLGIDFVDTIPPLMAAVARGQQVYFIDDVHWNALGHSIAAQAIEEYMKSQTQLNTGL